MIRRAHPDEIACTGVWPITGRACKNLPRDGHATCDAHAHEGDQRKPAPADDRRCTATNKESGERCRRIVAPGAKVCRSHGGASTQARNGTLRRSTEAEIMTLAVDLIGTPVDNPLVELGKVAGRARAWMEMLEERVHALLEDEPDPNLTDKERAEHGIRYRGGAGEQTRAEVALYERAINQLGSMLTAIAKLDIDRRLVQIEQDKVDLVATAVDAAIREAGLDAEQALDAKRAVVRHLRAVN